MTITIPPCKPKLPDADKLYPYLQQIDDNHYYSNFGPLLTEFHKRMADWLKIDFEEIMTASSGMTALELAIQVHNPEAGSYAMVPSWTFIATAQAPLNKGLKPFFVDCDRDNWALTPEIAEKALQEAPGPVSCVLPVAPFGLPLPVQEWEDFSSAHNIPVIIDGAALAPDDIEPSETVPIMVSTHATKILNTGEGGLLIWKNKDKVEEIKIASNFGLTPKSVEIGGTNAKMSEYHAAVGLASIDCWEETKVAFMSVVKRFHENFENTSGIRLLDGFGTKRFNSFCVITYDGSMDLQTVHDAGITVRPWWRRGCHNEPFFKNAARTDLPNTEYLADHSIGLPCYRDLTADQIDLMCETVIKARSA